MILFNSISTNKLVLGVFLTLAFLSLAFEASAQKMGDLLIAPMRIVLENKVRFQNISLMNIGPDTATYDVSIACYKMTENGTVQPISAPEPGQLVADSMIRFFPRRVKLKPRESQILRLQARIPSNTASGEYRSHLYFRAAKAQPFMESGAYPVAPTDSTAVGVKLSAVYGISIPVIIRVGNLSAKVRIQNLNVMGISDTSRNYTLNLDFLRSGDKSVYGEVAIKFKSPSGNIVDLTVVKGVAIYTPNSFMKFQAKFRLPDEITSREGIISVQFLGSEASKENVLAEAEYVMNSR
jgi:hypothetical protein